MGVDEAILLLSQLGVEVLRERGSEVIAHCPGHLERTGREDSNPSWSFNSESGMHNCFSCGFKGGLLYLVAYRKGLFREDGNPDWPAARDWLGSRDVDLEELMSRLDVAKKHAMPFAPVEMSEARLAVFAEPPAWALGARGIRAESASTYGVLWDDRKSAWITPIREASSFRLLGWQEKGEGSRHFRNLPAGVQKSRTLFGIERWSGPNMIVVESPLDVVRLHSSGWSNAVSTFGASISQEQIRMMMRADELVIALDNDSAGLRASEFVLRQSRELGFECRFLNYTGIDAKDVGDMSDEEVRSALVGARHCVLGRAALA